MRVRVPTVGELLPIVNARVRAEVISIAPMLKDAVPMFIPAVVAVPELANWATSVVSHAPEAVFGVQLVLVYHAVEAPALPQTMVWA